MNAYTKQLIIHALHIVMILAGTFVMGMAYNMFYAPNNILLGGFAGIAKIICYLIAQAGLDIPMSVMYLLMNIVLYIFAVRIFGKMFAIYAIIGIVSYSLFLDLCKFSIGTNDLLLCSIYGGAIVGLGLGFVLRTGASTGGSDMLGLIVNKKNPKISVGWVTILVNFVVIVLGIIIYGLNLSLYAVIAIFISGKAVDLVVEGPKSVKAYYIITKNVDLMSERLSQEWKRGITKFDAIGQHSGQKMQVILCLISGYQIIRLKQIVYDIDKSAFLFSVPVSEAIGQGFNPLKIQKQSFLFSNIKVKPANKISANLSITPSAAKDDVISEDN